MSQKASGEADSSTGAESDNPSVECPTCDRSDFASEQGMKKHHAMAHGESLAGEKFECDWCGDVERKKKAQLERYENNFCGDDCRAAWNSKTNSGEGNPNHRGKVTVVCKQCGTEDKVIPSREDSYTFCSKPCQFEWRSVHRTGEDAFAWIDDEDSAKERLVCTYCGTVDYRYSSTIGEMPFCGKGCESKWRIENESGPDARNWKGGDLEFECAWCGETDTKNRSEVERNEHNFCDDECHAKWQSEQFSGENNPQWRGGYEDYYGPSWHPQRRKALDRDNHTCQDCGLKKENADVKIHVHHIIPFRKFDDHEAANELRNLVTLCEPCHNKWEGLYLRPDPR